MNSMDCVTESFRNFGWIIQRVIWNTLCCGLQKPHVYLQVYSFQSNDFQTCRDSIAQIQRNHHTTTDQCSLYSDFGSSCVLDLIKNPTEINGTLRWHMILHSWGVCWARCINHIQKKKERGHFSNFHAPWLPIFSLFFFFSFKNDFSFLCACIFSASLNFVGGDISEILNYAFKDTEICAIKTSCISENDDQKLAISGCSNRQQDYWLF